MWRNSVPRILSMLLIACAFVVLLASGVAANWQFGTIEMVRWQSIEDEDDSLRTPPAGRETFTYAYARLIGGISLEATAKLDPSLEGRAIYLEYAETKPDGSRLEIKIGDQKTTARLYDWQLVPIARFADSGLAGVVSLFGPKSTEHEYHIIYHPAFKDTLIGMRLLQADILLMSLQNFSQLPTSNGRLILGPGEKSPQKKPISEAANSIQALLTTYNVDSWIITDVDQVPIIRIRQGKLELKNEPYFFFWREDHQNYEEVNRLKDEYDRQVTEYNQQAEKLKREFDTGKIIIGRRVLADTKKSLDELKNQINQKEPKLIPLDEAKKAVQAKRPILISLVPPVFVALDNTANFAALFRLVKQKNPDSWRSFFKELEAIQYMKVETPNIWDRKAKK
jgi:hypothetical protein